MLTVYLLGGQEVEVDGGKELKVELGERFPGTEETAVICVGEGDIPLAHFRAGAVLGYRPGKELP